MESPNLTNNPMKEYLELFSHFADEGTEARRLNHGEKAGCFSLMVLSLVLDASVYGHLLCAQG